MHFRIDQWRAWAPDLATKDDWRVWSLTPRPVTDEQQQPDVSFLPAMQRRRLSRLARMVFQVAWPLAGEGEQVPLVFCSRHGETPRTLDLLCDLARNEPLSPTQFSLSVHNAIIGQWSIMRGDTSEMTAMAATGDGLEQAVMEATLLLREGAAAVLVVVAEETPPPLYRPFVDDVPFPFAVALRLTSGDDWTLQLQSTAEGESAAQPESTAREPVPAAGPIWPGAIDLVRALCDGTPRFEHQWKSRRWIWSQTKG